MIKEGGKSPTKTKSKMAFSDFSVEIVYTPFGYGYIEVNSGQADSKQPSSESELQLVHLKSGATASLQVF